MYRQHHSRNTALFFKATTPGQRQHPWIWPLQRFQFNPHRPHSARRIRIITSSALEAPMQASIGAMFRATFNTSETLPLGDDGPDRSRSDRGFKRRRQASRFRTVAKRYHGFARHFATEGDHTIRGRDDGVLRPCTQIQTAMPRQPLFSRRIIFADYLRVLQRPLH